MLECLCFGDSSDRKLLLKGKEELLILERQGIIAAEKPINKKETIWPSVGLDRIKYNGNRRTTVIKI